MVLDIPKKVEGVDKAEEEEEEVDLEKIGRGNLNKLIGQSHEANR